MRNGGAEGAVFGFFRVNVNPLMVAGGVRELVDAFLFNNQRFTGAECGAD